MEPPSSAQFSERAARYRLLDAEPAIRVRTSFFAAAAAICDAFSCVPTTAFIVELSAQLEEFNQDCANAIRVGSLYPLGHVRQNTVDFIAAEQTFVQARLLELRIRHRHTYQREMKSVNEALRICGTWCFVTSRWPPLRALSEALGDVRVILGRRPLFELQIDRELIGLLLAVAADGRSSTTLPGSPGRRIERGAHRFDPERFLTCLNTASR